MQNLNKFSEGNTPDLSVGKGRRGEKREVWKRRIGTFFFCPPSGEFPADAHATVGGLGAK